MDVRVGFHVSIAGGISNSVENAVSAEPVRASRRIV